MTPEQPAVRENSVSPPILEELLKERKETDATEIEEIQSQRLLAADDNDTAIQSQLNNTNNIKNNIKNNTNNNNNNNNNNNSNNNNSNNNNNNINNDTNNNTNDNINNIINNDNDNINNNINNNNNNKSNGTPPPLSSESSWAESLSVESDSQKIQNPLSTFQENQINTMNGYADDTLASRVLEPIPSLITRGPDPISTLPDSISNKLLPDAKSTDTPISPLQSTSAAVDSSNTSSTTTTVTTNTFTTTTTLLPLSTPIHDSSMKSEPPSPSSKSDPIISPKSESIISPKSLFNFSRASELLESSSKFLKDFRITRRTSTQGLSQSEHKSTESFNSTLNSHEDFKDVEQQQPRRKSTPKDLRLSTETLSKNEKPSTSSSSSRRIVSMSSIKPSLSSSLSSLSWKSISTASDSSLEISNPTSPISPASNQTSNSQQNSNVNSPPKCPDSNSESNSQLFLDIPQNNPNDSADTVDEARAKQSTSLESPLSPDSISSNDSNSINTQNEDGKENDQKIKKARSISSSSIISSSSDINKTRVAAMLASPVGLGPSLPAGLLDSASLSKLKRSQELHDIFPHLPKDELLIEEWNCAWQRDILLQGRIFLLEGHLCFYAKIFGWTHSLTLELDDIVSIEKRSIGGIIPNSIEVSTMSGQKHFFASFLQRDSAYNQIIAVWGGLSKTIKMETFKKLTAYDSDEGSTFDSPSKDGVSVVYLNDSNIPPPTQANESSTSDFTNPCDESASDFQSASSLILPSSALQSTSIESTSPPLEESSNNSINSSDTPSPFNSSDSTESITRRIAESINDSIAPPSSPPSTHKTIKPRLSATSLISTSSKGLADLSPSSRQITSPSRSTTITAPVAINKNKPNDTRPPSSPTFSADPISPPRELIHPLSIPNQAHIVHQKHPLISSSQFKIEVSTRSMTVVPPSMNSNAPFGMEFKKRESDDSIIDLTPHTASLDSRTQFTKLQSLGQNRNQQPISIQQPSMSIKSSLPNGTPESLYIGKSSVPLPTYTTITKIQTKTLNSPSIPTPIPIPGSTSISSLTTSSPPLPIPLKPKKPVIVLRPSVSPPCPCSKTHHTTMTRVWDATYPTNISTLVSILYSPSSQESTASTTSLIKSSEVETFMSGYLENQKKVTDLNIGVWESEMGSEEIPGFCLRAGSKRKLSYVTPLTNPLGPKSTRCIVVEEVDKLEGNLDGSIDVTSGETECRKGFVCISSKTVTPDVPSGHCFETICRTCFWSSSSSLTSSSSTFSLVQSNPDGEVLDTTPSVRMQVFCQVIFHKFSFLTAFIQSAAPEGMKTHYKDLDPILRDFISKLPIPPSHSSISPSPSLSSLPPPPLLQDSPASISNSLSTGISTTSSKKEHRVLRPQETVTEPVTQLNKLQLNMESSDDLPILPTSESGLGIVSGNNIQSKNESLSKSVSRHRESVRSDVEFGEALYIVVKKVWIWMAILSVLIGVFVKYYWNLKNGDSGNSNSSNEKTVMVMQVEREVLKEVIREVLFEYSLEIRKKN